MIISKIRKNINAIIFHVQSIFINYITGPRIWHVFLIKDIKVKNILPEDYVNKGIENNLKCVK